MPAEVVIIGAGPGGLTAARELRLRGVASRIVERAQQVGGLAKTVEREGLRFDLGGHRFYTKVPLIASVWRELLGEDLLERPRLSRIYYRREFYQYPLRPVEALARLGCVESARSVGSFLKARAFPRRPEQDLESWLINRFGTRLYETFFQTYTEKVWGLPCREISAEWAAQRIQGLSLGSLIANALGGGGRGTPKTLIDRFHYPRLGPGMLWERVASELARGGCELHLSSPVDAIRWAPGGVRSVIAGGREHPGTHFLSTMPIRELIEALDPAPPLELREAAAMFSYRDFLTVVLVLDGRESFPDNWVYVHEPQVRVGRIQNFGNWSPEMTAGRDVTCLGMEYFCFAGDGLWSRSDAALVELARHELGQIGLADPARVRQGWALRVDKAYPVYDGQYREGLRRVREFLTQVPNLQLAGRNGMHRYNNMDHSMLTGILAARNILGARYDLWKVNADAEYLEREELWTGDELAAFEASQPRVPRRMGAAAD